MTSFYEKRGNMAPPPGRAPDVSQSPEGYGLGLSGPRLQGGWPSAQSGSAMFPIGQAAGAGNQLQMPQYALTPPSGGNADVAGIQQAMERFKKMGTDMSESKLRTLAAKYAAQDNSLDSRSATGEGKGLTYKTNDDDHATGTAAWDSLGQYMKKGSATISAAQLASIIGGSLVGGKLGPKAMRNLPSLVRKYLQSSPPAGGPKASGGVRRRIGPLSRAEILSEAALQGVGGAVGGVTSGLAGYELSKALDGSAKTANEANVSAYIEGGMNERSAIKKAYPDWSDAQIDAFLSSYNKRAADIEKEAWIVPTLSAVARVGSRVLPRVASGLGWGAKGAKTIAQGVSKVPGMYRAGGGGVKGVVAGGKQLSRSLLGRAPGGAGRYARGTGVRGLIGRHPIEAMLTAGSLGSMGVFGGGGQSPQAQGGPGGGFGVGGVGGTGFQPWQQDQWNPDWEQTTQPVGHTPDATPAATTVTKAGEEGLSTMGRVPFTFDNFGGRGWGGRSGGSASTSLAAGNTRDPRTEWSKATGVKEACDATGLTPYQLTFAVRVHEANLSPQQIKEGINKAGEYMGEEYVEELREGMDKIASMDKEALGSLLARAVPLLAKLAPKAGKIGRGAKNLLKAPGASQSSRVGHVANKFFQPGKGGIGAGTTLAKGEGWSKPLGIFGGKGGLMRMAGGAYTGNVAAGEDAPWYVKYPMMAGGAAFGRAMPRMGAPARAAGGRALTGGFMGMVGDEAAGLAGIDTGGRFGQLGALGGFASPLVKGQKLPGWTAKLPGGKGFGPAGTRFARTRMGPRSLPDLSPGGAVSKRMGAFGDRVLGQPGAARTAKEIGLYSSPAIAGAGIAGANEVIDSKVEAARQKSMQEVMNDPRIQNALQMAEQGGGLMDSLSGVANMVDPILELIGIDPSQMNPMMKILLMAGGGLGIGGLLSGSKGAGMGGVGMMAVPLIAQYMKQQQQGGGAPSAPSGLDQAVGQEDARFTAQERAFFESLPQEQQDAFSALSPEDQAAAIQQYRDERSEYEKATG